MLSLPLYFVGQRVTAEPQGKGQEPQSDMEKTTDMKKAKTGGGDNNNPLYHNYGDVSFQLRI